MRIVNRLLAGVVALGLLAAGLLTAVEVLAGGRAVEVHVDDIDVPGSAGGGS